MGGGGKGGGGGTKIPEFVKEAQKSTSEKSKQLYDITKPSMSEATKQLQSLITTGGPGAQVPIIANIEEGQRRAFGTAMNEIGQAQQRGGGASDPSYRRILEQANIDQQAALKGIAPQIAGPLVSSTMGASLGGLGLAQQGYQSAAQALASGVRRPQQGSGTDWLGIGSNLAKAYSDGGFGSKGGGGNFNMPTGPSQNIWSGGSGQLTFGGGF